MSWSSAEPVLDVSFEAGLGLRVTVEGEDFLVAGNPQCTWRPLGGDRWTVDRATYGLTADGLAAALGPLRADLSLRRLAANAFVFEGRLTNTASVPVELARFHYFDAGLAASDADLTVVSENGLACRRFSRQERLAPGRQRVEAFWRSLYVDWPRLDDPLHGQADWGTGVDVGLLARDLNGRGLLLGLTGPCTAFGEIGYGTARPGAPPVYVGLLLDGVRLDPGHTRPLDRCLVVWDDCQTALKAWACRTADDTGVAPKRRPPMTGYCSWYQRYWEVTPADVLRAAAELADAPVPAGGRTVQLDDGFQRMPGDWRPNDRFAADWEGLPARIADTGAIAGLWLAPTMVFHRHPIVSRHPDWLQRLPGGEPAVSFSNWGWCDHADYRWGDTRSPTYLLEPDHPEARRFIRSVIESAVAEGWRYLKLDFAYALSTARRPYNPRKTSLETLRDLFALFREAAGSDVTLCACIGVAGRYALAASEFARLGGDIGDSFATVRANLLDLLLRACTNGVWWQADPDVFYLRRERSKLTEEESWLLTGSVWLIGGMVLTSDFPGQWDERARRLVGRVWDPQLLRVPVDTRFVVDASGLVKAYRVSFQDAAGPSHLVGLYNWADTPQTARVDLAELGLSPPLRVAECIPAGPPVHFANQALTCAEMPSHSLRVVRLVPPHG